VLLDKNQPTRGANPAFLAVPPQFALFVIDAAFRAILLVDKTIDTIP
jgi:hypothetical protein